MAEQNESKERAISTGLTKAAQEDDVHTTTPQVQTPDKPSQAEGDRETVEADLEDKELKGMI